MRRVVDREGLKTEQRPDGERETAGQPHSHERRGKPEQASEHDETQLGP